MIKVPLFMLRVAFSAAIRAANAARLVLNSCQKVIPKPTRASGTALIVEMCSIQ
jgi:hypothetical protein